MIINQLEYMWKEAITTYYKVQSKHLSGIQINEQDLSRILSTSANYKSTTVDRKKGEEGRKEV
jgi:hypothetical protein